MVMLNVLDRINNEVLKVYRMSISVIYLLHYIKRGMCFPSTSQRDAPESAEESIYLLGPAGTFFSANQLLRYLNLSLHYQMLDLLAVDWIISCLSA